MKNSVHILSCIVVVLTFVASGFGLFYIDDGEVYTVISQYGNEIELYGNGIYKNDSAFLVPIFRGTDFIIFFIVAPLLLYFIYLDRKQNSLKSSLRFTSLLFVILYYTFNLSLGVIFNPLHLVYTVLFSTSFFALLFAVYRLSTEHSTDFESDFKVTFGLKIFIFVSGFALFLAWLPDIIFANISDKPLSYLENYTTSVTYILDMGFLSPLLFLSLYLLKKHTFYGICLLSMLFYLSMIIGIILPAQTVFQMQSGIEIPLPELITKVLIFMLLSAFAFYFNQKLYKSIL